MEVRGSIPSSEGSLIRGNAVTVLLKKGAWVRDFFEELTEGILVLSNHEIHREEIDSILWDD